MKDYTKLLKKLDRCAGLGMAGFPAENARAIRELEADVKQITETNIGLQAMYYDRGEKINSFEEQVKGLSKGESKQKLVDIICQQKDEIETLKIIKFVRFSDEECWIYQNSVDDNLATLVCPVVIAPEDLLALKEQVKEYDIALTKLSWDFYQVNIKDLKEVQNFAQSERNRIKAMGEK